MSLVSRCMHPSCSLLNVTGKRKVQISKSHSFVTVDNRSHVEVTFLTARKTILKFCYKATGHCVVTTELWGVLTWRHCTVIGSYTKWSPSPHRPIKNYCNTRKQSSRSSHVKPRTSCEICGTHISEGQHHNLLICDTVQLGTGIPTFRMHPLHFKGKIYLYLKENDGRFLRNV
jgi:hypothetical protein